MRCAVWWEITWGQGDAVWPSPCEERRPFDHHVEQSFCTEMNLSVSWARFAGIGILSVILGILLLLGCWYCRRRSGYRSLKVGKTPIVGILPDPGPASPSVSEFLGSGTTFPWSPGALTPGSHESFST